MVARRQAAIAAPEHREAQHQMNAVHAQRVEHVAANSQDPLEVGAPIPKAIGLRADLYSDVRALRLAMEKEVEQVKKREAEIRESIISDLSKSADTGAAGLRYRAQIVTKTVPKLADWHAFTGYILANDRFDLIQKRPSDKAIMDMLNDGIAVPGIEKMNIPEVSITKI